MEFFRKAYWFVFALAYLSICACGLIFVMVAFVPLACLERRRAAKVHKRDCLRINLSSARDRRSWQRKSVPTEIEMKP
jgi:hypothetical protein